MKISFRYACSVLSLAIYGVTATAQVLTARPNTATSSNSNGFYEYLPQGYSSGTDTYPLIVCMHGDSKRGDGSAAQLPRIIEGLTKVIYEGRFPTSFTVNGQTHKFIVIAPQFVLWPVASQVEEVVNYAVAHYRVNHARIYVTGYSMGGGATWEFASDNSINANRIAAIVPVSGASLPTAERGRVIAGANLPVWALHNHADPKIPAVRTNGYIDYINTPLAPTPAARKTIFSSYVHDAWTQAYDPAYNENGLNVYEWMLQYQRTSVYAASNSPVCRGSKLMLAAYEMAGATYKWTGPGRFTSTSRTPVISSVKPQVAGLYTVTITKGTFKATATTAVVVQSQRIFYNDKDRDYFGTNITVTACRAPADYVAAPGDCNDANVAVYPGAPEAFDGLDNDCNGFKDDGPPPTTFYQDWDQDGFGTNSISVTACAPPVGYVAIGNDCDDRNAAVNPGAVEIGGNNMDDNCNGVIDERVLTRMQNAMPLNTVVEEKNLQLSVAPNPATHQFTLNVKSNNPAPVQVRIVNASGRLVDVQNNISPNSTLGLGRAYAAGIYYIEAVQGKTTVHLKVVKLPQ